MPQAAPRQVVREAGIVRGDLEALALGNRNVHCVIGADGRFYLQVEHSGRRRRFGNCDLEGLQAAQSGARFAFSEALFQIAPCSALEISAGQVQGQTGRPRAAMSRATWAPYVPAAANRMAALAVDASRTNFKGCSVVPRLPRNRFHAS